jgi:diguanylate cyclase
VVRDGGGRDVGTTWVVRPESAADADAAGRAAVLAEDPLAAEIGRSLAAGHFTVRHRPMVDLASGAVVAVEARLQWRHPDRGLLPPETFAAAAARSAGLAGRLLDAVAGGAPVTTDSGRCLPVAVELSAAQISDPGLPGRVAAAVGTLRRAGGLWIDVPETALAADVHRVADRLRRCEAVGASVGLSAFGAGFPSLAWLRRLPVRRLRAAAAQRSPELLALAAELGIAAVAVTSGAGSPA